MAQPIVMPAMGMYTEEGVLTAWLRQAGEHVEAGDAIAEITTEKTAFEIPSPAAGSLHPVAEVGSNLQVESLMGYILAEGETVPAVQAGEPTRGTQEFEIAKPAPPPPGMNRPVASPAARRLAAQHGIDLSGIAGSGPGGRIVEADVQARIVAPTRGRRILRQVPMTGSRRSIAAHLRSSLNNAASTTLTREANAGELVAARRHLAAKMGGTPSCSALFIKLLAGALRARPELNAAIENDSIVIFDQIHIGFAVAVPGGLVVPVLRDADTMTLAEIDRAVRELGQRALAGRLSPSDVDGGTATITNLGNYGVDAFTPILNGPQSAVLGIGRIEERPVVRDGALAVGQTCVLSLTFDHRVADGVPAAELLEEVVRRMSDERFLNDDPGQAGKKEVM